MRLTSAASALVLGAAVVLAKELPKDEVKAGMLTPLSLTELIPGTDRYVKINMTPAWSWRR